LKKQTVVTAALFLFALILTNCNSDINNKFTIKNYAAGQVSINFRGDLYPVNPGATFSITDIPKGTYTYATTYALPIGTTGSSAEGDVTGSVVFVASTRILVVYSSTFKDSTYTLYATISNSDDQTADTGTTP
jgi:hypothetical protein